MADNWELTQENIVRAVTEWVERHPAKEIGCGFRVTVHTKNNYVFAEVHWYRSWPVTREEIAKHFSSHEHCDFQRLVGKRLRALERMGVRRPANWGEGALQTRHDPLGQELGCWLEWEPIRAKASPHKLYIDKHGKLHGDVPFGD